MTNRMPAKSLEGRRIRILHAHNVADGSTGVVSAVDTDSGNVAVALEAGPNVIVNWGTGDRWMIIPAGVAAYPATV